MKVLFADFGNEIASSRLRARIPQQELKKLGIKQGNDVLIYGKHFIEAHQLEPYKRLVFDVCDDHFDSEILGEYYRTHVAMADVVTCNSKAMQDRIKEATGRDATIVLEPYESDELEPSIGPKLLWYGHMSNVADLERLKPSLKHPLLALSNMKGYVEWTPEVFHRAISSPCIVVIPVGKKKAKSENRMVEAIRCGKYVCAESLPAYEPFAQFYPLGNIAEHIDSALANPAKAIHRIKEAQAYIRDKYSPKAIGEQWLEVINGIN